MKGLLGLLLLVGFVAVYWKLVLAAVVVVLIVRAAPIAYREWQTERAAERTRLQALISRADQQHQWSMTGDPRGMHGEYPPAFEGNQTA